MLYIFQLQVLHSQKCTISKDFHTIERNIPSYFLERRRYANIPSQYNDIRTLIKINFAFNTNSVKDIYYTIVYIAASYPVVLQIRYLVFLIRNFALLIRYVALLIQFHVLLIRFFALLIRYLA